MKGHAGNLDGVVVLYPLNGRRPWDNPVRFSSYDVVTLISRRVGRRWDQIFMYVPSNALCDELLEWIRDYGGGATIVKLQPGLRRLRNGLGPG